MYVLNIDDFPYVEFGENPKRQIRLIMSPQTLKEDRLSIVHVVIPPYGVSEGHVHEDSDEIIYFDKDGKALLDGKEYYIKRNSILLAPKGKVHECINISSSENLNLLCIFVPPLKPYGLYPELIKKTGQFIENLNKDSV